MEEYLGRFRPKAPPSGFAERVLAPARERLELPWTLRLWGSRRFWATAAAALVALAAASRIEPRVPQVAAPFEAEVPAPALAKEIAEALGDGDALEARLALQLAPRRADAREDEEGEETFLQWRDELWPG